MRKRLDHWQRSHPRADAVLSWLLALSIATVLMMPWLF